jgi:hypothetical protein
MVDTTPTAMTAEGLAAAPTMTGAPRPTIKIKRPKPVGGSEEGDEEEVHKNYSQNVSFIKLS